MNPLFFMRLLLLAQSDNTLRDFAWQVRGLIAFICTLSILWLALLVLTIQRRSENKRRKKLGMDPLPNMWVGLYHWATGQAEPSTRDQAASVPPPESSSAGGGDALPAPDLTLLTGELDDDEASDTSAPTVQADAASTPAASTPRTDAPALAQDFSFDEEPQAMTSNAENNAPPDAVDVMRVYRDVSDGMLIVEMAGQQFSTVDEMRSADLERRFTKIVRELAILVRDAQKTGKRPPPSRQTPRLQKSARAEEDSDESSESSTFEVPRPTPRVPTPNNVDPTPPDELPSDVAPEQPQTPLATASSEATSSQTDTTLTDDDDLPSMAPGAMLRGMSRAAFGPKSELPEEAEPEQPLTIAEQIDMLLQARLALLPAYKGRTIRVRTAPSGGVRIQVDETYYDGVGDVADDDVRTLLQDVVREWEQSNT